MAESAVWDRGGGARAEAGATCPSTGGTTNDPADRWRPLGGPGRQPGGVKGDLNILLVGSDSRSGLTAAQQRQLHVGHNAGQRSDTMILLHIPRGGGKAILVSLPRDSYVTIPRHKDATGHVVPASMNKL